MKKLGLMVSAVVMSLTICSSAFAYSINSISEVKSISASDKKAKLGVITIKEDSEYPTDFNDNDIFTITLPEGVSFDQNKTKVKGAEYFFPSSRRMELTLTNTTDAADKIKITPVIKVQEGAIQGDVIATIDGRDSAITSASMLIAKILP